MLSITIILLQRYINPDHTEVLISNKWNPMLQATSNTIEN